MPEFRPTSEISIDARGDGWTVSTLAGAAHVPGMAMTARLWRLEPGSATPEESWSEARERFLYVVSGSGTMALEGRDEALAREDMVWIEAGDRFSLKAGDEPLTVLDAASA